MVGIHFSSAVVDKRDSKGDPIHGDQTQRG